MGVLDPPVVPSRLNRAGLSSALPAASAALAGVTWTYTDTGSATYTGRVDRCDGSAWVMIVPPSGTYVAARRSLTTPNTGPFSAADIVHIGNGGDVQYVGTGTPQLAFYGTQVAYSFGGDSPGDPVVQTTQAGAWWARYYGPTQDDSAECLSAGVILVTSGGHTYTQTKPVAGFEGIALIQSGVTSSGGVKAITAHSDVQTGGVASGDVSAFNQVAPSGAGVMSGNVYGFQGGSPFGSVTEATLAMYWGLAVDNSMWTKAMLWMGTMGTTLGFLAEDAALGATTLRLAPGTDAALGLNAIGSSSTRKIKVGWGLPSHTTPGDAMPAASVHTVSSRTPGDGSTTNDVITISPALPVAHVAGTAIVVTNAGNLRWDATVGEIVSDFFFHAKKVTADGGVYIVNTGGTGVLDLPNQSSTPSAPSSSHGIIYMTTLNRLAVQRGTNGEQEVQTVRGVSRTWEQGTIIGTGTSATVGSANQRRYVRARGTMTASKIGLGVGTSSGNISVAVHRNTGSGASAAPGALVATSGSVACPASGYNEIALGSSITILDGDWISVAADNTTATFWGFTVPSGANAMAAGLTSFEAAAFTAPATATPTTAGTGLYLQGVA